MNWSSLGNGEALSAAPARVSALVFISRSGEPFPSGVEVYAVVEALKPIDEVAVDNDLWVDDRGRSRGRSEICGKRGGGTCSCGVDRGLTQARTRSSDPVPSGGESTNFRYMSGARSSARQTRDVIVGSSPARCLILPSQKFGKRLWHPVQRRSSKMPAIEGP